MEQKSIKNNLVMSAILTVANTLFPLLTFNYVAKVLDPSGIGKVSFVSSVLQYFSYIACLGIGQYGLRECAKVRDNKIELNKLVYELLVINLVSTVLSYILLIMAILLIHKFTDYRSLFLVMSGSILLETLGMEWLYRALEEYSYITKRSLIFKCISVVLTFILIRSPEDYLWYGFLTLFTASASYICNFLNVRKFISLKKVENIELKKHMPPIMSLFFAEVVVGIYANFDVSMLGFISTDNEVGVYSAALKIKAIIIAFSTVITNVLVPRISYHIQKNENEKVAELIIKSVRVSFSVAIPLAVCVFVNAKNALLFVCGDQYVTAESTLRVLTICVILFVFTNLFGNQILIPYGKEKRYSQSVFIGMWINIALNLILIPVLGSFGAAIGTLVTEVWNVMWLGLGAKTYLGEEKMGRVIRKYIPALLCASIANVLILKYVESLSTFLQLCIGGVVFCGVYYGILLIQKDDLIYEIFASFRSKLKIK